MVPAFPPPIFSHQLINEKYNVDLNSYTPNNQNLVNILVCLYYSDNDKSPFKKFNIFTFFQLLCQSTPLSWLFYM